MKLQFEEEEEEALPPELKAGQMEHHLQCPTINNTGGDSRVPEDDLKKWSSEVWQDTDLFSFRISS